MTGLSNDDKIALILSVGRGGHGGRRKLSPLQVADMLHRCIEAGDKVSALSAELQIGTDMIRRFLSLRALSADTRALVDWGSTRTSISFSAAVAISRLKSLEDQTALATAIVEFGLTQEDALYVVQRAKRASLGIDEAIVSILALRPVYIRTYLAIGQLSQEASMVLDKLELEDQTSLLNRALEKLLGGTFTGSVRVAQGRFTVSLSESEHAIITSLESDFEAAVNGAICAVISAV